VPRQRTREEKRRRQTYTKSLRLFFASLDRTLSTGWQLLFALSALSDPSSSSLQLFLPPPFPRRKGNCVINCFLFVTQLFRVHFSCGARSKIAHWNNERVCDAYVSKLNIYLVPVYNAFFSFRHSVLPSMRLIIPPSFKLCRICSHYANEFVGNERANTLVREERQKRKEAPKIPLSFFLLSSFNGHSSPNCIRQRRCLQKMLKWKDFLLPPAMPGLPD
jgi:hypothetical protein